MKSGIEVIPTLPLAAWMVLPFLVTFVALRSILFKPLLAYLNERDHAVQDARHQAGVLADQAAERLTHLEARLATARDEVTTLRTAARARAQEHQAQIINAARAEADGKVKQAVARLAGEREAASRAIRDTSRTLSGDIAAQVLGRPVEG